MKYQTEYEAPVIRFHQRYDEKFIRITWHCQSCNTYEDVTELVAELCQRGVNDCPSELYQAWKILRLGTTEYRFANHDPEFEHSVIRHALEHLRETTNAM